MRRLARWLWIATTPIALTFLLAAPQGRAQHGDVPRHAAASAEHAGTHGGEAAGAHGGGHVPSNPIVNWLDFSYSGQDTHGNKYVPEDPGSHKKPAPFGAALFNFVILAFLVGKYAGPSLKRYVQDRHDSIARQLDEASRLRAEAEARLAEYQRKVASLDADIDKLVRQIREEAEAEKVRLLAEAEARATRIRRDAEMQVAAEITRARELLEREVGLAAVAAAEKLLRERLTPQDQRDLADRYLKDLEAAARSGPSVQPGGRVA